MDKSVIPAPRAWTTAMAVVTLAASLLVISVPELRGLPARAALMLLALALVAESLLRLRRAGGMGTPLAGLHRHLPVQASFPESLCRIAATVAALTVVFAF